MPRTQFKHPNLCAEIVNSCADDRTLPATADAVDIATAFFAKSLDLLAAERAESDKLRRLFAGALAVTNGEGWEDVALSMWGAEVVERLRKVEVS